jgi:hypothetical protein
VHETRLNSYWKFWKTLNKKVMQRLIDYSPYSWCPDLKVAFIYEKGRDGADIVEITGIFTESGDDITDFVRYDIFDDIEMYIYDNLESYADDYVDNEAE